MHKVNRKTNRHILQQNEYNGLEYLTFEQLTKTGLAEHLFTTRFGGCSTGIYESMNLSYSRGDRREAVDENFSRVAKALHSDSNHIVCTDQTHTTNIRVVTKEDASKGVILAKDYHDIDGLVTNVKGLILSIFYADCVPLLFLDPVRKAIGAAHSGWRGTVGKIGKNVVTTMQEQYGTKPEDLIAVIGPSICQDCYEVSADVAQAFEKNFAGTRSLFKEKYQKNSEYYQNLQDNSLFANKVENIDSLLFYQTKEDKYQLNLWMANFLVMLEAGILPEKISVTDICTCCNPDYLFSHRVQHEKRGNLGAFIKLCE